MINYGAPNFFCSISMLIPFTMLLLSAVDCICSRNHVISDLTCTIISSISCNRINLPSTQKIRVDESVLLPFIQSLQKTIDYRHYYNLEIFDSVINFRIFIYTISTQLGNLKGYLCSFEIVNILPKCTSLLADPALKLF